MKNLNKPGTDKGIIGMIKNFGITSDKVSRHRNKTLQAAIIPDSKSYTILKFLDGDNQNADAACFKGLIPDAYKDKRPRVVEACKILNQKNTLLSFSLDDEDNINAIYDPPLCSPDNRAEEIAYEISTCTMSVLDSGYMLFMKAIYTNEPLDTDDLGIFPPDLLLKLMSLREYQCPLSPANQS